MSEADIRGGRSIDHIGLLAAVTPKNFNDCTQNANVIETLQQAGKHQFS